MKKLTALIVDDEFPARENMRILLNDYCPEIEVIGTADGVKIAKSVIAEKNPDIVFLDIRMPSGTEGFDLLSSFEKIDFMVVFVTAFKDYAIRAFKANAIEYILKPIDIDDLQEAVKKLLATHKSLNQSEENLEEYTKSITSLQENLSAKAPLKRITIRHSKGIKVVNTDNIIRLQADNNCTVIHFNDGSKYLDTRTLKVYEELLDDSRFLRTHKSHIANLNYLSEYVNHHGHYLLLQDSSHVPVARSKAALVVDQIKSLA